MDSCVRLFFLGSASPAAALFTFLGFAAARAAAGLLAVFGVVVRVGVIMWVGVIVSFALTLAAALSVAATRPAANGLLVARARGGGTADKSHRRDRQSKRKQ